MAILNDLGTRGDNYALFLRVFAGEVVAEYNKSVDVANKLRSKTIQSGKSATFPTVAKGEATVWTPGEDIFLKTTSDLATSEKIVVVNKMLITYVLLDEMEEMMAHYDVRQPMAAQMGASLATAHDRWSIAALLSDATAGAEYGTAGEWTVANAKAAIEDAASKMDGAGVPREGRTALFTPAMFYSLINDSAVIDHDYNSSGDRGTAGNFYYLGFQIVNSAVWDEFNNEANLTASGKPLENIGLGGISTGAYTAAAADDVEGLAFQKDAAATVVLKGMTTSADWIPARQGNLLVARQAIGVDVLRPTSVVTLKGA